jgi:hypothetical protein
VGGASLRGGLVDSIEVGDRTALPNVPRDGPFGTFAGHFRVVLGTLRVEIGTFWGTLRSAQLAELARLAELAALVGESAG